MLLVVTEFTSFISLCLSIALSPSSSFFTPALHSRTSHCFMARCCSLKGWNSLLHGGKIKPDLMGEPGREKGVAQAKKIRANTTYLAVGAVTHIINIDGYGLLDCTCFWTMKFIVLLFLECMKACSLAILRFVNLLVIHTYKVSWAPTKRARVREGKREWMRGVCELFWREGRL